MKIFESYNRNFRKFSSLSKIAAFVITAMLFFNVGENLYVFYANDPDHWRSDHFHLIQTGNIFLFSLSLIFGVRFAFLYSEKSLSLIFSQLLWVLGIIGIWYYRYFTNKYYYPLFLDMSVPEEKLLWASRSVFMLLHTYVVFSIIKQLSVFFFSLFEKQLTNIWKRL